MQAEMGHFICKFLKKWDGVGASTLSAPGFYVHVYNQIAGNMRALMYPKAVRM